MGEPQPCPSDKFDVGTGRVIGRAVASTITDAIAQAKAKAASQALIDADKAIRTERCDDNCVLIGWLEWKPPGIQTYSAGIRANPTRSPPFVAIALVDWIAKGQCVKPDLARTMFPILPPKFFGIGAIPWRLPE